MNAITFRSRRWLITVLGLALCGSVAGMWRWMSLSVNQQPNWTGAMYPLVLFVLSCTTLFLVRNFFLKRSSGTRPDEKEIEDSRVSGITCQGNGMLDEAFAQFRKCPVDEGMKSLLYDLAGDYERAHMLEKALEVYEYIQEYDDDYKDIASKIPVIENRTVSGYVPFSEAEDPSDTMIIDAKPDVLTIGRYEIIEELGMGAMGLVYRGLDPKINRVVAIKTLRFVDEDDEEHEIADVKKRFYREAEAAGGLSHPNIVTIYDVGEDDDILYISMEYLEGVTLAKHGKKPNLLSLRRTIRYLVEVCEALDYAHAHNIVHRDIKPANIMILKNETVKVADFGIARMTASSKTQTGIILGTPNYMSPEQVEGKKVDGRSDIFSLGIVFYQLLTGELPFRGSTIAQIMNNISKIPHIPPRQHNPRIPKACIAVIDKALEKDVNKRYQKVSTFGKHLAMIGQRIDALTAKRRS